MSLPRPCIECGALTRGRTRCPGCEAKRNAEHHARRASAPGDGAASRLRRALRRQGFGVCAECGVTGHARGFEVDHVVPLWAGGGDTLSNLQVLCTGCHRTKTSAEATGRAKVRAGSTCGKPRSTPKDTP